jgi:hypothetical protein
MYKDEYIETIANMIVSDREGFVAPEETAKSILVFLRYQHRLISLKGSSKGGLKTKERHGLIHYQRLALLTNTKKKFAKRKK